MLALLPAAVAMIAVLAFRANGLIAAALACLAAVAMWLWPPLTAGLSGSAGSVVYDASSVPPAVQGARALADAALLTAIVAAMIVPGILFVEATRQLGSPDAITDVLTALRLPPAQTAMLLATGFGVLLESLTGMGVSLLVTTPMLLAIVPRRQAIGLALVSMSLMPWGALAISGIIGAKLAGLPVATLAHASSFISGAVALILPMLCLAFVTAPTPADRVIAVLTGVILFLAIAASTATLGIEVAGVAGGLAVIVMFGSLAKRNGLATALAAPALRPYAALFLLVVIQKIAITWLASTGLSPTFDTGRTSFPILASPGVALTAAVLLTARAGVTGALWRIVTARAWRPVLTVALFMVAARLMVETGAVEALANTVSSLGVGPALVATALLGAASGFATGSGVTGNALFMPSAAATGRALGEVELFSAIQHGAAGHVAMASLPVAAILLAALPNRSSTDDRTVLVLGLRLAAIHLAVIVLAGFAWRALS